MKNQYKGFYEGLLEIHDNYNSQLDIITSWVYNSNDENVWNDFMLFLKAVDGGEKYILRCVQLNYRKKFGETNE